jgi:prepilin-type N-terminal cleavage/methylation domain-containing protein
MDRSGKTIGVNILSNLKGFTLLEVLVTLTLLLLLFGIVYTLYWQSVSSSLKISKLSERLRQRATLFWEFTRSLYGAKTMRLENGTTLYLITTGGQFYRGVVQAAYIYANGTLYYYEFPYPLADITYFPQKGTVKETLGKFKTFKIAAYADNKREETLTGTLPRKVQIQIDNDTFCFFVR